MYLHFIAVVNEVCLFYAFRRVPRVVNRVTETVRNKSKIEEHVYNTYVLCFTVSGLTFTVLYCSQTFTVKRPSI